jgi:hypothetical protein
MLTKAMVVSFIFASSMSFGCKEHDRPPRDSVPPEIEPPAVSSIEDEQGAATVERTASAVSELRRSAEFFYQIWNQRYEVNFRKLSATLGASVPNEKRPFSGHWYPETKGGTNAFGALTKYDRAFHGNQTPAATWEQKNHTRSQSDKDAGWAGHCNGWAASAQRHAEPQKSVVRNGVTFTPNDIKALLAEVYMNANSVFLGGTRCGNRNSPCVPTNPDARPSPTQMNSYEDVNPAAFHVVLTNWIGRFKHPVLFDEKNDGEVWNYPIYHYVYSFTDLKSAAEAQALISNDGRSTYKFNPEATKFVRVDMTVTFSNALGTEPPANQFPNHTPHPPVKYQYVLELNSADEILGGEWTKANITSHPDFVWVALEPGDNPTGDASFGNPHVNADEVIRMWAESIGADPNNPPTAITTPNLQSNWGKFPEFTVTLDGHKNGAVFSGSKTKVKLLRSGRLAEKITLEFGLNDQIIKTLELEKGELTEIEFDSPMGLNRLAFIWKQSGTEPYNTYVRYFAIQ